MRSPEWTLKQIWKFLRPFNKQTFGMQKRSNDLRSTSNFATRLTRYGENPLSCFNKKVFLILKNSTNKLSPAKSSNDLRSTGNLSIRIWKKIVKVVLIKPFFFKLSTFLSPSKKPTEIPQKISEDWIIIYLRLNNMKTKNRGLKCKIFN